jgi:hypothetical protein
MLRELHSESLDCITAVFRHDRGAPRPQKL